MYGVYLLYDLYVRGATFVPFVRSGIRLVRSKLTYGSKWTYNYRPPEAKSCTFFLNRTHRASISKHHVAAVFHHLTVTLRFPQRAPRTTCTQKTYINSVGLVYDFYDFYGLYLFKDFLYDFVRFCLFYMLCTFPQTYSALDWNGWWKGPVRLVSVDTCFKRIYFIWPYLRNRYR